MPPEGMPHSAAPHSPTLSYCSLSKLVCGDRVDEDGETIAINATAIDPAMSVLLPLAMDNDHRRKLAAVIDIAMQNARQQRAFRS